MPLTYTGVGVDYGAMDPFKRMCQRAGLGTASSLERFGFAEFEPSRGESAYLIETPDCFLAHVEEGLGTKNLVADAMYEQTGESHYDYLAQDAVAMIVNDMITVGALPLSVAMHLAVGDSSWFVDEDRCQDLANGWAHACQQARCVWGGGETPTLKDVVIPGTVVLSGSAIGLIRPKERRIDPANIQVGDAIVLVRSSGIHANGLTLARRIAAEHPDGYLALLSNGLSFGAELLRPTLIYVLLVEDCQNEGVSLHYAVNITGHGWRKLMRAPQPLSYVIENIPEPQPVFTFMQERGPITDEEAYGNLNMGAGFALYVPPNHADWVVGLASALGLDAMVAGHIEESEQRQVVIQPKSLVFTQESLQVR